MRSIKANLTRDWLIISCLLLASVVVAIYSFTQVRARQVLDRQLQQFAHLMVVHDLASDSQEGADQPALPENLMVRQWRQGASTAYVSHPEQFKIPFDLPQGFSTVQVKSAGSSTQMRVYALKSGKSMIQVAAPLAERDLLSRELGEALLLPVIVILLVFMGIFRWRMRKALDPLQRLHEDIAVRKNGWKQGLDEEGLPAELAAPVQAINQLVQRLFKNMELQQHFIADAAHELRTPLTALRLQLGNLQQSLSQDQQDESAESLQEMTRGINRATRLVEQLLQLARLQHQGQTYQAEAADIVPLIHKTMAELSGFAAAANMELAYEGPDHARAMVYPFALRILLENLLQNAFKYGQSGAVVQVCLELPERELASDVAELWEAMHPVAQGQTQSDHPDAAPQKHTWVLSITNEGSGIDPAWHPRIFERFFRLSEHQNLPGSGLGLPIVREIGRLHGSEVFLEAVHEGAEQPGLRIGLELPGALEGSKVPSDHDMAQADAETQQSTPLAYSQHA